MSLSRRGLFSAASLSLAAVGAQHSALAEAPPSPSRSWTEGDGERYRDALAQLQAYVEDHRRAYGLPGLTLCIVDAQGYRGFITSGYADLDRREPVDVEQFFQIGSISKSLTSLCVFRAVEAGRLRLDSDIRTLVPGVHINTAETVTLQTLLNHSSGLAEDAPMFPRVTEGRLWLGYRPGDNWSYSNLGYELLSIVVEAVYGEMLEQVVLKEVFQPLGLTGAKGAIRQEDRSSYAKGYCPAQLGTPYPRGGPICEAPWTDVASGDGNVAMTSRQMALYLGWLISAGRHRGAPILNDESAKRWVTATVSAPGWSAGALYANGLAVVPVDGRALLHHTGGMTAFSSSLHVDPDEGIACFASTNLGSVEYRPRDITAFACGLFRTAAQGAPPPSSASTRLKALNPADYEGTYQRRGGGSLEIRAGADGLEILSDGRIGVLEPLNGGLLLAHHPGFTRFALQFARKNGRPVAVWYGDQAFVSDLDQPEGAAPDALRRLAGRYDDPSGQSMRIAARASGLFLDGVVLLTQLADGSWRPASDDSSPERLWFDAPLNGVAQRLSYSGKDLWRVSERI